MSAEQQLGAALRAEGYAVLVSPGAANYRAWQEEIEAQDGLAAAVLLSHDELVRRWCNWSDFTLRRESMHGSWGICVGTEPTMWGILQPPRSIDGLHLRQHVRKCLDTLESRQKAAQCKIQVHVSRPADGAYAQVDMLVNKTRVDDLEYGPHTTQGMQAMHSLQCTVRKNLDSMVAALDRPTPPCAACGGAPAFGQHQYAMRIVPPVGEHGLFAVDIELTRLCVRCGDTNADEVSMIVGSSADSAQRGLDALRDGVVMIARARAQLRSTLAEVDNTLPRLQAALGIYLDAYESTNEFVKVVDMHAVAAVAQRLTTLSSGATARIVDRVCAVLERTRVIARQHEHAAGARDIIELELPTAASELRECAACGGTKAYEAFSDNQWRKARPKRRCIECQSNGVPRDDRVRDGARADTIALLEAFEAFALNERQRVDQELARRNAEHNDNDCPICFGETAEAERVMLHDGAAHWVCVSCRVDLREHGLMQCPSCRAPCDAYEHSD
jgi:hypothetical protein